MVIPVAALVIASAVMAVLHKGKIAAIIFGTEIRVIGITLYRTSSLYIMSINLNSITNLSVHQRPN